MRLIQFLLLLLSLIHFSVEAIAQRPEHLSGELLIQLGQFKLPDQLLDRHERQFPTKMLRLERQVSRSLNIWLLKTSENESAEREVLEWLKEQPEVVAVQFNHVLEYRGRQLPQLFPDDPLFTQQWQHRNTGATGGVPNADLDSELAWEISTGGLTALNDTIVVAVIDGGIAYQHEDLRENMWRNYLEVPGDGIDNDGNGFIDDFLGWNVFQKNDNILGNTTGHGTPVSAIVGAKGNNSIGVTGINWDVKMLFVAGNSVESAILEAYDYVLTARKRYNATNGQEGAFIVAVNCSWGVNQGQPSAAPLWCAAFDSLGAAGILSVAATANMGWDVDLVGDLPTACPSDFLVSVTNLDKYDQKTSNAAWGAQSIDLGAYGKDIFTAGTNNSYGYYSGTSFAAPQVSGAIALLYAAPCDNLARMARSNPASAALYVKDLLLNSATPNSTLNGITVSNGRLNCGALLQDSEDQCVDCLAPFGLQLADATTNSLTLQWSVATPVQSVRLKYRKAGGFIWNEIQNVKSPLVLENLYGCKAYYFILQSACANSGQSAWTAPVLFRTEGCCEAPSLLSANSIQKTSAVLTWTTAAMATEYRIRIKPDGGAWQSFKTTENTLPLSNLMPCTTYSVELQSQCGVDSISQPALFTFSTTGCGTCTDAFYCLANGQSADAEWIAGVQIGLWVRASTGKAGYEDFTGNSGALLEILPDANLQVLLSPGFSGLAYKEYFRIYIDYNGDGDFADPDELAFDPGFASDSPVAGEIVAPANMGWGPVRMRILMKYKGVNGTPPTACESFEFGQVEDYCVHLGPSVITTQIQNNGNPLEVYPQPANQWAWVHLLKGNSGPVSLFVVDAMGNPVLYRQMENIQTQTHLNTSAFTPGLYMLYIQTETAVYCQKLLVAR